MLNNKKVVVVLPAYNCERTLRQTFNDIPRSVVDEILLVDDASTDRTALISRGLGIKTFVHEKNAGYGANQKTCYREALRLGADIIVMLHPDYQYDPRLIPAMASLIAEGLYDVVIASRILGTGALKGGMPLYKYIANRALTLIENIMIGQKVSEYHTGYRAYSRALLESLPMDKNSDDFVFDNQILLQAFYSGYRVGEVSCPTSYNPGCSSINFYRSVKYGIGVLYAALQFALNRRGILKSPLFSHCINAWTSI